MTLQQQVVAWATEKNITKPENAAKQFLKLAEEYGELHLGLLQDDAATTGDAIGDCLVVSIILAEQLGYNLVLDYDVVPDVDFSLVQISLGKVAEGIAKQTDCSVHLQEFVHSIISVATALQYSAEEELSKVLDIITKRKGTTVDGVFIKDES